MEVTHVIKVGLAVASSIAFVWYALKQFDRDRKYQTRGPGEWIILSFSCLFFLIALNLGVWIGIAHATASR